MTPPRRPSPLGPLVWWELARLARRGHATRARVMLLYTLLLAFVGFAAGWSYWHFGTPFYLFRSAADPLTRERVTVLANSLALVLLEAQLLLVAVITPAYAASAISEEKDRRTLPLLLTTDLTDREIVWGKAVGRGLFVLSAVLAGVPVWMLTLFLGGVDPQLIAAGYALAAGTAILCAAVGVSAACHAPDTRTALVRAYAQTAVLVGGTLVPPFVLFSPFAALAFTQVNWSAADAESVRFLFGFGYPVGQLVVAWVLMAGAARGLRQADPTAGPVDRTAYPEPPRGRPAPIVFGPSPPGPPALPPLADADPVLWKERHVGRAAPLPVLDTPVRWLGTLFALLAVTLFVTGGWALAKRAMRAMDPAEAERMARRGSDAPDAGGGLMAAAGVFAAGLYLLPLAVGVTGCVAGERHRATLDSLLTTTLGRRAILRAKVRAHAERGLVFAAGAVTAAGCAFGADGGARLGLAAMAAVAAGFALVAALGAWLSVRCATPVRAFRLCLPAVVAVVGLPVLVWNSVEWAATAPAARLMAWTAAGFAAAAGVLWWRAGAELERGNG